MDQLAIARRALDEQPFSRLMGARLTAFGDGAASLEIDVDDRLRQQYGLLHGGVHADAADGAAERCAVAQGTALTTGTAPR